MEIKYTLEILTKDIQDIEKLVGNLQNSLDGSAIELDLALSKLRNVYEILTMIKADRLHELISPEKIKQPLPAPPSEPTVAPEPTFVQEPFPIQKPDPEPVPKPLTMSKAGTGTELKSKKDPGILAEKFSAESSINENLGGQRGSIVETKLHGPPIANISRNIGINDRFLIIRELFGGNADRFTNLVSNLEAAGNYQDAISLLEEQFSNLMEHEGVEILSGLIKRRFTQS